MFKFLKFNSALDKYGENVELIKNQKIIKHKAFLTNGTFKSTYRTDAGVVEDNKITYISLSNIDGCVLEKEDILKHKGNTYVCEDCRIVYFMNKEFYMIAKLAQI